MAEGNGPITKYYSGSPIQGSGIGIFGKFGEMAQQNGFEIVVWVLEDIFELGRLNDSVVIYLFFGLLLNLNRWYLMGMIKV